MPSEQPSGVNNAPSVQDDNPAFYFDASLDELSSPPAALAWAVSMNCGPRFAAARSFQAAWVSQDELHKCRELVKDSKSSPASLEFGRSQKSIRGRLIEI